MISRYRQLDTLDNSKHKLAVKQSYCNLIVCLPCDFMHRTFDGSTTGFARRRRQSISLSSKRTLSYTSSRRLLSTIKRYDTSNDLRNPAHGTDQPIKNTPFLKINVRSVPCSPQLTASHINLPTTPTFDDSLTGGPYPFHYAIWPRLVVFPMLTRVFGHYSS